MSMAIFEILCIFQVIALFNEKINIIILNNVDNKKWL